MKTDWTSTCHMRDQVVMIRPRHQKQYVKKKDKKNTLESKFVEEEDKDERQTTPVAANGAAILKVKHKSELEKSLRQRVQKEVLRYSRYH